MKTVFDKTTRDELITRINSLNERNTRQWGTMTLYQMLEHCIRWDEMATNGKIYKQSLMGKLFGKVALKSMVKDETPVKRNMPTMPDLVITGSGDIQPQKEKWIALIERYAHLSDTGFVHPFFGKMTKEQIGFLAYKHADHHLRQFNG